MRLPVPDRLLDYEVNELGEVKSLPRTIMRGNRWWTTTPYQIGGKILKYDIKECNGHKLKRVQIYNSELKYRIHYYIARLVYAVFNNKDYDTLPNIHYKDGDTMNCNLDNLYETTNPRQNKRLS